MISTLCEEEKWSDNFVIICKYEMFEGSEYVVIDMFVCFITFVLLICDKKSKSALLFHGRYTLLKYEPNKKY